MQLTLVKETALRLIRIARSNGGQQGLPHTRCNSADPDPAPQSRWSKRLFVQMLAGYGTAPSPLHDPDPVNRAGGQKHGSIAMRQIDVCVSAGSKRLKSRYVTNTVYGPTVPARSFMSLGSGLFTSCPELLFVELANSMALPEHLLLGFELCGNFSRNPDNPMKGTATLGIPPATSVKRIAGFINSSKGLAGTPSARKTLELLADNAWSPAESVVAAMMSLPLEDYGYGLGRCRLNPRFYTPSHLEGSAKKNSRVPDILLEGTHVGINYDGAGHLDLDSIASKAFSLAQDPASGFRDRELSWAIREVREKVVDDIRRNRELAADGLMVFPMTKEDLYEDGGLDAVMMQVMEALAHYEGWDVAERQGILQSAFARRERQALLTSMLPGRTREVTGKVAEAIVKLPARV